jgi:hypothetical protein
MPQALAGCGEPLGWPIEALGYHEVRTGSAVARVGYRDGRPGVEPLGRPALGGAVSVDGARLILFAGLSIDEGTEALGISRAGAFLEQARPGRG